LSWWRELNATPQVLIADGENEPMPITIILILAAAPALTLSMLLGTDWSPEALMAGRGALAAAVVIAILWVVVDALQALKNKWFRLISRPY
jgi:hypothetical protein